MSERTGIPLSTLSKVEHDRLTLTYDKLLQLSQRLNLRMSELFAEPDAAPEARSPPAARSAGSTAQSGSTRRTTTTTTCAPSCAGSGWCPR
ncbi:helix-turn-helix domain-containing protein [Phenylobacterium sp. J426]|uniref:helix-turn-helix domain-containing protein n=1 Tax=Phenylobacterium sp. J426 TaxID=2898439 RepID=UPI0035B1504A